MLAQEAQHRVTRMHYKLKAAAPSLAARSVLVFHDSPSIPMPDLRLSSAPLHDLSIDGPSCSGAGPYPQGTMNSVPPDRRMSAGCQGGGRSLSRHDELNATLSASVCRVQGGRSRSLSMHLGAHHGEDILDPSTVTQLDLPKCLSDRACVRPSVCCDRRRPTDLTVRSCMCPSVRLL
jgi:hypothetical protein